MKNFVRKGGPALVLAAALLIWLAIPSGASAQCQCYEDGCFDVGRCGYPGVYGFESWCRCNGGTPGWRDCTAADQVYDGSGAQCVAVPVCMGLPPSCGDSGSSSSYEEPPQEYVPPPHAEEMQRARELYYAGQQTSQPPYIPPYVAPGAATEAVTPAATGTTQVRRLASKVPPLPSPNKMSGSPALDPDEKSYHLPPLPESLKKLVTEILNTVKNNSIDLGDEIISDSPVGNYYKIIKATLWARDKAVEAMDTFLDLARRGFPEEETRKFVNNQEKRYAWEYFGPSIPLPEED